MIELIQFPWSPFCIVQRRILEYAGVPFTLTNIPPSDRSLVWRLTRHRYYAVPIIKHDESVVFETDDDSQVIAKYLDDKLELGLFPRLWAGIQFVLWRYFENEIESVAFKLNDIYYEEFVPESERLPMLRHKERKFGHGCLHQWQINQKQLLEDLAHRLMPCEQMLMNKPFLLGAEPLFVDFDLYGMLGNFLFSGHYRLPESHTHLQNWYQQMTLISRPAAKP
jgi:glutathione S-transferase